VVVIVHGSQLTKAFIGEKTERSVALRPCRHGQDPNKKCSDQTVRSQPVGVGQLDPCSRTECNI
jgi:hypothetical protein